MSIKIAFKTGRKNYSNNTKDFLAAFLANGEEDDRDNLINLMEESCKALKVKEANALLRTILLSIVINDGVDDIEILNIPNNKENENSADPMTDESLTQAQFLLKNSNTAPTKENLTNTAPKKESLINMGASGSKPTNQTVDPLTTNDKPKPKTLCKFYQKGKCRHNDNCRFDHPKICYKFRAFGLKTHNEKGCETNCSYFHPNACRDSLKTKTCKVSDMNTLVDSL